MELIKLCLNKFIIFVLNLHWSLFCSSEYVFKIYAWNIYFLLFKELLLKGDHIGMYSSLPSLICLIDNNMIRLGPRGLYIVANEVLNVKLQYLKKNLCSNFYRLLYSRGGSSKVRDLNYLLVKFFFYLF